LGIWKISPENPNFFIVPIGSKSTLIKDGRVKSMLGLGQCPFFEYFKEGKSKKSK